MANINRLHEMSVAGWTVGGILQMGVHKGAVKYRFKAPKSDVWLPGSAELPAKVQEPISLTKVKVKRFLRDRLAQWEAGAVKKGKKATTTRKAAPAKQSKTPVKKAAGKK
mmetsp:Transcript_123159/g.245203  ORF Transcript_123159/g.245203 Transcript_123159/m.245203 type:complete len:110 (-) Transcript_123159:106-435(-)|eukprot:CAMPEP_0172661918 /NCGR_PEP_ID=MMETSP1074-20121228/5026_1 /TAXON_ID=2916 /ORGANISM="Ceratium fusus, Strain PA161109" /LENGTH=109 /DNA_ID=CAMNT_0013477761 /DNA_START=61 /DNA_END=390 /DNA_ORIENTATION=-